MGADEGEQVGALAGRLHAATAQFVDVAASFDESEQWAGIGLRSCAHWLTIATGIDLWNARETLRVGHALRTLPLIHEAFTAGRLSFDKVRALTRVATPEDQAIWLQLSLDASGAQLARICHQFRRSIAVDDPDRAAKQRVRRRLVSWWLDDDGMLALYATLPPEEGRLVLTAIESAVSRSPANTPATVPDDPCAGEEADHPYGARRADALVRICEGWLANAAAAAPAQAAAPGLVVHVDIDTLAGSDTGGRCHLEDGPAVSLAVARRVGCDTEVVSVVERDGVPLDVGRSRRIVSGRMRTLLRLRDQGCRYPGCAVPAANTEGHHVVHWADGGRTDLANLVSLCRFHHHRHHEGAFRVIAGAPHDPRGRNFRFETADGRTIAIHRTSVADAVALDEVSPGDDLPTPAAGGNGAPFDLDHTILVLAANIANNTTQRSSEQPAGP
jgi:hypothetical protein